MTEIKFSFFPYGFEKKQHIIEKSENGKKRRYLKGVTSGMNLDGHGERLTPNCIKSLQDQANSGDILLYADKHGIKYTEDIGILTKSEILPNGDWLTEYRLYDEQDGVGQNTLEKVAKLWKQLNGIPPYSKPIQKGFSIEGFIPEDGIVQMSEDGRRVIDNIDLEGTVVVPRPAYGTSVAKPIYKALRENPPWIVEKVLNNFKSSINDDEVQNGYFRKRHTYQDKLEEEIENIMLDKRIKEKDKILNNLFDEYKDAMIELILQSPQAFQYSNIESAEFNYLEKTSNVSKVAVLKNLYSNLENLENFVNRSL